tara:strand:- start:512 stop:1015 length:504 start_codon:yes stop_codon:yes gene_type:complete
MNNKLWWFQRESNATFFKALLEDLNKATEDPAIKWVTSSYHNDACGSVAVYVDSDSETIVQLFAYETEEDQALEQSDHKYGLTASIVGEFSVKNEFFTNDREEAIAAAVKAAVEVSEEYLHQLARDFMKENGQDGWQTLSLDEWLLEYGEQLSEEVRSEGETLLSRF